MGFQGTVIKVVLFGLLIHFIINSIIFLEPFRVVYNQRPGPCKIIPGIEHGAEDIVLAKDGTAFISSGLASLGSAPEKWDHGRIFTYKDDKLTLLKLNGHYDTSRFIPHGISIFEDSASGKTFIYVINHVGLGSDEDKIDVFEYKKPDILQYLKSISSELFAMANNLKVLDKDKFYITKFQHFRTGILQQLEMLLQLPLGGVVYYDGEEAKSVFEGLFLPNGIDVSPEKKYLYVQSGKEFLSFRMNADNSLELIQKLDVGSAEDNVNVDTSTGDVWLAGHPITYKILIHIRDNSYPTPSHVLQLKMKDGRVTSLEQIFADDGQVMSGSAVALHNKGSLLIGTVHHKLMHCKIN